MKIEAKEPATIPAKRTKGRPIKLTKNVAENLIKAISEGCSYGEACRAAGISKASFHKYRALGEKERQGNFKDFVDQLAAAEMAGLMLLEDCVRSCALGGWPIIETRTTFKSDGSVEETTIRKTAPPDGRLALLILEKRSPKRWGKSTGLFEDLPLEFSIMGNVGLGTSPLPTDIETEEE
jgi:hypothetical protein